MTHVTCRLTAKNLDQLRNPTLGNRARATYASRYFSAATVELPQPGMEVGGQLVLGSSTTPVNVL